MPYVASKECTPSAATARSRTLRPDNGQHDTGSMQQQTSGTRHVVVFMVRKMIPMTKAR